MKKVCIATLSVFSIILFLLLTAPCFGATYYIDNNAAGDSANGLSKTTPWKRHPYMYGFTGAYTHAAGDVFVFKGGVTWKSTVGHTGITIATGGAEGKPDIYTVDKTWYVGSAWSYPVIDGNAQGGSNYGINTRGNSNLVFDGLKFYNIGNPANGSGQGLFMGGGSHIEVKNCWFETMAVNALFWGPSTASDHDLSVHDNHFKRNGRVHILASTNCRGDNVRLYHNLFEGPGDYNPYSYHCDGFMVGGYSYPGITNLKIYGNKFYGDWHTCATALIYLNSNVSGAEIYNNVLAHENASGTILSPGFIHVRFGRSENIRIYNNTISSNAGGGVANGIALYGTSTQPIKNVYIINNIFSGVANDVSLSYCSNVTMDYNLHSPSATRLVYDATGGTTCTTLTGCRGKGYELNAPAPANPQFVKMPIGGVWGSGDWHLQSTSPAKDKGAVLSLYFTTDLDGVTRSQGPAWDIGAYEYAAAGNPPPPLPPPPPPPDDPPSTSVPAAPSSLRAKAISTSRIDVTWRDNSNNESGFKVQRCKDSKCVNSTTIAFLKAGATKYSDTGLSRVTAYFYRVCAYNAAGSSAYSNIRGAITFR